MLTKIRLIVIVLLQQLVYCLAEPALDISYATDNAWIYRLFINLVGYSLILVPSAVVVFLVKNELCFKFVRDNSLIKLFVYGNVNNVEYNHNDESDDKLLPITKSDNISKDSTKAQTRIQNVTVLLYCFFGLQLSYLSWGLLQEKIMTTHYQIDGNYLSHQNRFVVAENVVTLSSLKHLNGVIEAVGDKSIAEETNVNEIDTNTNQLYYIRFKNSQFIVLVNRLLAFIVAFSVILIKNRQKKHSMSSGNEAPLYQYIYCSLSNVLSSWCQYEALKYVSFPTQVLSKACKLLPVMFMSQIIGDKKYRTIEYLFAVSISLGMTMFLWSDHQTNSHHKNLDTSTARNYSGGLIILILYLTFDSFTSNWQGIIFEKYKVSTFQMMASVNLFSILLTLTSLTQQGDLIPAFQLVFYNYNLFRDCVLLSLFSATGQLFVFYTISKFGALVFVTIMTLRQAFAILLSCLIYNHSLALMGIIGVVIVFCALFAQIYWKSKSKGKR